MFTVPLDETRVGTGQVVGKFLEEAEYYAFFASAYPSDEVPDAPIVVDDDIVLLGLSLDGQIFRGTWTVIGNVSPRPVQLPSYKTAVDTDTYEVMSPDGRQRRPASKAEALTLPNRRVVAPTRLEKALKAYHGLGDWDASFDEIRVPRKDSE